MFKQKSLIASIFAILTAWTYPQQSAAETFTSEAFLDWNRANQAWYLEVSVTMAAAIAAQNVDGQSSCIYEWYFEGGKPSRNREDELLQAMNAHPSYHPHAVILAVLQRACGSFAYATRGR